jgi:hypothetical protein
MKHLLLFIICSVFAAGAIPSYAMPVGNIGSPAALKKGLVSKDENSRFGFILGAEVDLNSDRNMKSQARDTEYFFYGGKGGIVIGNKAYIYGLVGGAEANQKYKISGSRVEWDTKTDLAWGVGGTAVIYEKDVKYADNKGILRIGVDGKYRSSDLGVDKVKVNDTIYCSTDPELTEKKFNCDEWQAAIGVSYQFNTVSPYAGVKYSDASGKAKATVSGKSYEYSFDPKSQFGIFAGLDVLAFDSLSINAEGRFIDETAFSASAILRF